MCAVTLATWLATVLTVNAVQAGATTTEVALVAALLPAELDRAMQSIASTSRSCKNCPAARRLLLAQLNSASKLDPEAMTRMAQMDTVAAAIVA